MTKYIWETWQYEYISKLELDHLRKETFETTKLTIYFTIVWISIILFAIFEVL